MKQTSGAFIVGVVATLLIPTLVSAHERGVFQIGEGYYQVIIGSQSEPVVVDDKSGLDLRVQKLPSAAATSGTPLLGLENSLKLEIAAEGQKRVQDITTVWGQAGAYNSLFYPTMATVLTYRVFGTIDTHPVDLSFTCHAGAHVMGGMEDRTPKDMGGGVTRIMQAGMFSCPRDKAELGFPVQSASLAGLAQSVHLQGKSLAKLNRDFHFVEIALGLLAVAFAAVSLQKKKKPLV